MSGDEKTSPETPSADKETGRLEAFSDGVFAVAITLLALDIKVPPLDTCRRAGWASTCWTSGRRCWPMSPVF